MFHRLTRVITLHFLITALAQQFAYSIIQTPTAPKCSFYEQKCFERRICGMPTSRSWSKIRLRSDVHLHAVTRERHKFADSNNVSNRVNGSRPHASDLDPQNSSQNAIPKNAWLRLPDPLEVKQALRSPVVELTVASLVLLGCLLFALQTLPWDAATASHLADAEDAISWAFIVEYFLRWYGRSFRPSYLLNPAMIIDFVALLPLLLRAASLTDVKGFTFLRVLRVLRLQRFFGDQESFQQFAQDVFGKDFQVKPYQLQIARTASSIFTLLFIAAGLVYMAESPVNDKIPDYFSAFYFALTTLTTVGFGDIYPVTPAGRGVVSAAILIGICLIPYQLTQVAESILASTATKPSPAAGAPATAAGDGAGAAPAAADPARGNHPADFQVSSSAAGGDVGSAGAAASGLTRSCERCGQLRHEPEANFCWSCGAVLRLTDPAAVGDLNLVRGPQDSGTGNDSDAAAAGTLAAGTDEAAAAAADRDPYAVTDDLSTF